MKFYKIEALGKPARWAGTQAEAAKLRKEFTESGNKRSEITSTDVDVPTSKDGLLAFLNKMSSGG